MGPLIDILKSSEVLMRFDRNRSRANGDLKYSAVQMITIITYIEIKRMTYDTMKRK